jgi:predicted ATPase
MTSARPARLTHLYVENWRSFTRVDADLDRRAVLVGPNASGKTNLLDALGFLRDVSRGGFQAAVKKRGGVPRLRCLAARNHSDVLIAVHAGAAADGPDWEYELCFTQEGLNKPAIQRERVTCAGEDVLSRPDDADRDDPERLTETALVHPHSNREFRELAALFASIRYVNPSPEMVREPARSAGRERDPFGGDLIQRIAATAENVRHGRLRRILALLSQVVPRIEALELWRDPRGAPHLRARYGHWRPQGAWHLEDQFSDGTLRLLAILWEALDGSGPLLVDEPELSLDPATAREVLPLLETIERRSQRQTLIATHSPDLLAGVDAKELLLLVPGEEETEIRPATTAEDGPALLEGRLSTGQPPVVDENQLFLFETVGAGDEE